MMVFQIKLFIVKIVEANVKPIAFRFNANKPVMNIISDMKATVVLWLIVGVALSQSIIDFSHTDAIQKTITAQTTKYDVQIHPSPQKTDYLLFPGACTLQDSLSSNSVIEYEAHILEEEQRQLVGIKDQIKQLLKVSELIKTAKKNIQKSASSTKGIDNFLSPLQLAEHEFEELQSLEVDLKNINLTIQRMVGNLSQLIIYEINKTKNSNFDSIRLNFQLKINQARLQYLQFLKRREPTDSSSLQPYKKTLFRDIKDQIERQHTQFSKIDDLLQKFSDRQRLKLQISNLESQLQGTTLMISEKQQCELRRYDRSQQQNKRQLQRIIAQLKQLKKSQSHNHTYCEGVAPMLLQQLKKILKVYNYSFACSEGLPELKRDKIHLEEELAKLKNEESRSDYDDRSSKIKKYFKDEEEMRIRLVDDIRVLQLSEFTLNPNTLNSEIPIVKQRIKDISYRLQHPPEEETQAVEMDFDRIRAMIEEIQRQQNEYCKIKQEYLEKYRRQQVLVRSYEHRAAIYRDAQIDQMARYNQLRQLEIYFQTLRSNIMLGLE